MMEWNENFWFHGMEFIGGRGAAAHNQQLSCLMGCFHFFHFNQSINSSFQSLELIEWKEELLIGLSSLSKKETSQQPYWTRREEEQIILFMRAAPSSAPLNEIQLIPQSISFHQLCIHGGVNQSSIPLNQLTQQIKKVWFIGFVVWFHWLIDFILVNNGARWIFTSCFVLIKK